MSKALFVVLVAVAGCSSAEPVAPVAASAPQAPLPSGPGSPEGATSASAASMPVASTPASSPTASASATSRLAASSAAPAQAGKTRLGYADFLTIGGLRSDAATLDRAQALWGPGKRAGDKVRYDQGPTVSEFSGGLMIDVGSTAAPWVEKHRDGPLSIVGKSCAEAAAMLDFTDQLGGYTTCKHYEANLFLDVTILCSGKVTSVVVVWVPFDPKKAVRPLPADHCSG